MAERSDQPSQTPSAQLLARAEKAEAALAEVTRERDNARVWICYEDARMRIGVTPPDVATERGWSYLFAPVVGAYTVRIEKGASNGKLARPVVHDVVPLACALGALSAHCDALDEPETSKGASNGK